MGISRGVTITQENSWCLQQFNVQRFNNVHSQTPFQKLPHLERQEKHPRTTHDTLRAETLKKIESSNKVLTMSPETHCVHPKKS